MTKTNSSLPHSPESEAFLLSTITLVPGRLSETDLKADDFYVPQHAAIFTAMRSVIANGAKPDMATVLVALGGEADRFRSTLVDVLALNASGASFESYAASVRTFAAKRRRLLELDAERAHLLAGGEVANGHRLVLPTQPVVVNLADVSPEPVGWRWYGYFAKGKLQVLDGDPSVGKSTLMIDIGSRASIGAPWPDGSPSGPPVDVVLLSAEDGIADTIRPRVDAANGDPARFHVLDSVQYRDDDGNHRQRSPMIPNDIAVIEQLVRKTAAGLLIVDVMNAFLSSKVNGMVDQDVRGALMPLAKMAEATGCTVVVLRHLRKSESANVLYRGGGSIGIIGAARVGLIAGRDPDDETPILAVSKCNVAALAPSLKYELVDAPEHGCARVRWLGTSHRSAGDIVVMATASEREDRSAAEAFLEDALGAGPVAAGELFRLARDSGFTDKMLRTAKEKLGVKSKKHGAPGEPGGWRWSLPEDAPKAPKAPSPETRASWASSGHLRCERCNETSSRLVPHHATGERICPACAHVEFGGDGRATARPLTASAATCSPFKESPSDQRQSKGNRDHDDGNTNRLPHRPNH